MSSRSAYEVAVGREAAAAWQPAGALEDDLRGAEPRRELREHRLRRPSGPRRPARSVARPGRASSCRTVRSSRWRRSSARARRGSPGRRNLTVTTLYSCSPCPARQYATVSRSAARSQDPLGEAEADRELEVVPRRAHGDGERLRLLPGPVHPDLHRLLGDELVRPVEHLVVVERPHAHRRGRTARQVPRVTRARYPGSVDPEASRVGGRVDVDEGVGRRDRAPRRVSSSTSNSTTSRSARRARTPADHEALGGEQARRRRSARTPAAAAPDRSGRPSARPASRAASSSTARRPREVDREHERRRRRDPVAQGFPAGGDRGERPAAWRRLADGTARLRDRPAPTSSTGPHTADSARGGARGQRLAVEHELRLVGAEPSTGAAGEQQPGDPAGPGLTRACGARDSVVGRELVRRRPATGALRTASCTRLCTDGAVPQRRRIVVTIASSPTVTT